MTRTTPPSQTFTAPRPSSAVAWRCRVATVDGMPCPGRRDRAVPSGGHLWWQGRRVPSAHRDGGRVGGRRSYGLTSTWPRWGCPSDVGRTGRQAFCPAPTTRTCCAVCSPPTPSSWDSPATIHQPSRRTIFRSQTAWMEPFRQGKQPQQARARGQSRRSRQRSVATPSTCMNNDSARPATRRPVRRRRLSARAPAPAGRSASCGPWRGPGPVRAPRPAGGRRWPSGG